MKKEKAAKSHDHNVGPDLPANFDLEASLKKMESLTADLEKGNLSLAQGMACFEAGVKIYQECAAYLAQAEQKIKILSDALQTEEWKTDE